MLGDALLASLSTLPTLASVPHQRSSMVAGGTELSESEQTLAVPCVIATAQSVIVRANTLPVTTQPPRSMLVVRSVPGVPGSARAHNGGKHRSVGLAAAAAAADNSDAESDIPDADGATDDVTTDVTPASAPAQDNDINHIRMVDVMPLGVEGVEAPADPDAEMKRIPALYAKRKRMKPISKTCKFKVPAVECEVCTKPGCSIRCKHSQCKARICSALCGGYRNDANMAWAGGWACSQHMSSVDDHAWHCPLCSKMVTDRTDDPDIGVIISSIGCDKCNSWHCLECVGMHTDNELPELWYCGNC